MKEEDKPVVMDVEARKEALGRSMQERHDHILQERERNAETRKETKLASQAVLSDLEAAVDAAREKVEAAAKAEQVDASTKLDEVSVAFATAERALSEGGIALPSYEVRRLQNTLAEHKERFRAVQDQLQPKKRFGFRGKKKVEGEAKAEQVPPSSSKVSNTSNSFQGCLVEGRKGKTIVLSAEETRGKDVQLANLSDCHVHLSGCPSTLHMTDLHQCLILSGPVSTSVFLENCEELTLAVACQQLRAHSSTNSYFSLHVTSKAIVEDCKAISVAPYALTYASIEQDFLVSALSREVNNWALVDDFNWLATDKPSPNWSCATETDQRKFSF